MTKMKDVFNFNMNSIILKNVIGYLDEVGLSKLKAKIINILKEIEVGHTNIFSYGIQAHILQIIT